MALDPARVDAWRVRKQHLGQKATATIEQVATDLVGIQAQVMSSAFLSLAIRCADVKPANVAAAVAERRLVRAWAMRGTLHLFAADHFPTIAAALGTRTGWRRPAWFKYFQVTEAEMDRLIEVIGEVLADGVPRTRAELATAVEPHLGATLATHLRGSWGTLLKPLVGQGLLCHGGDAPTGVTFVRPDRWLPNWRSVDPIEARNQVFLAYLDAYGPATTDELARWWGVTRGDLKRALSPLEPKLAQVSVDGTNAWLTAQSIEEIESAPAPGRSDSRLRLLGGFDPFVVGAGLRERLIPKDQYTLVSRQSGWISPVVLVDGRVAAVWSSRQVRGTTELTVQWLKGEPSGLRRALAAEAKRLGGVLDSDVRLEFGEAYPGATPPPSDPDSDAIGA